jgi:hypothetical protein
LLRVYFLEFENVNHDLCKFAAESNSRTEAESLDAMSVTHVFGT